MFAQISKKIELKFWDYVIPLLSRSTWVSNVLQKMIDLYHDERFIKQTAIIVVTACAGFATGFLIFSLSTIFS